MEYVLKVRVDTPIEAFVTPEGARETIEVVLEENLPEDWEVVSVRVVKR